LRASGGGAPDGNGGVRLASPRKEEMSYGFDEPPSSPGPPPVDPGGGPNGSGGWPSSDGVGMRSSPPAPAPARGVGSDFPRARPCPQPSFFRFAGAGDSSGVAAVAAGADAWRAIGAGAGAGGSSPSSVGVAVAAGAGGCGLSQPPPPPPKRESPRESRRVLTSPASPSSRSSPLHCPPSDADATRSSDRGGDRSRESARPYEDGFRTIVAVVGFAPYLLPPMPILGRCDARRLGRAPPPFPEGRSHPVPPAFGPRLWYGPCPPPLPPWLAPAPDDVGPFTPRRPCPHADGREDRSRSRSGPALFCCHPGWSRRSSFEPPACWGDGFGGGEGGGTAQRARCVDEAGKHSFIHSFDRSTRSVDRRRGVAARARRRTDLSRGVAAAEPAAVPRAIAVAVHGARASSARRPSGGAQP
jgi:hypothetical protein